MQRNYSRKSMLQHLFSFCKMHRTYFILPITFDTYTYSRVIFMLFLSRLHTPSVCLPISLRLRVLQKGPGERREKKRLLVLICHPPLPPSLSLSLSFKWNFSPRLHCTMSFFADRIPNRCAAPTSSGLPGPAFRVHRFVCGCAGPTRGSQCPYSEYI